MKRCIQLKCFWIALVCCLLPLLMLAQTPEMPVSAEQQLENITENNSDVETEDDYYLQQLQQYIKHPVNLNFANEETLKELHYLNTLQIKNLLLYRAIFGQFINVYELQAIPGWTIAIIEKIRPYISINTKNELTSTIKDRLRNGEHIILLRIGQTIERSKGYFIDPATTNNFYPGSPQKILMRYKYQYKNQLQYGITGEKDAGEQFFKGKQKQGFDFYSAHFFAKNIGTIRSIALGDFTVNMGQGLIQWQSLAFKKSAEVVNIKREADVLRPYNSAGEINFHRGAGITIARNNWAATFFASYKKVDANLVTDTSQSQDDFISSLQTSGYHRTKSEQDDKGIQQQLAFGGNVTYRYKALHLGLNGIHYKLKLPLSKQAVPYNLYALTGNSFGNYSIDYSYTFKNVHLFGETAIAENWYKAWVNGALVSVSSNADVSFVYRNISSGYQSLYSSAFTESTYPNNERGMYVGLSLHPANAITINAYMDMYRFPWLKFRVDAPSNGADYLLQVTYKPSKQVEVIGRFRSESKAINYNSGALPLSSVIMQPKQNLRVQFAYKLNTAMVLNTRVEALWLNNKNVEKEQGFLTYINFLYKPLLKPWTASMRWQYFETDSYNSRLYAYENDVLYSFSIPVFYDKGIKYYININYDVNKKMTVWMKFSQTVYNDKNLIGSGLDEIMGNKKTEIKAQVVYKF